MFIKKTTLFFLSCFLLATVFISTANATIMTLDYSFSLYTSGTNPYGLTDGDIVTVSTIFDTDQGDKDLLYSSHYFFLASGFTSDTNFAMTLPFGTKNYGDHTDGSWTWAYVNFDTTGSFDGNDWIIDVIDLKIIDSGLSSSITIAIPQGSNGPIVLTAGGEYQGQSWSISSVPEPSTFALCSLGLFGLAWFNRRKSLK